MLTEFNFVQGGFTYIFFGESSKFPKSQILKIQIFIYKILTILIMHGRLSLDRSTEKKIRETFWNLPNSVFWGCFFYERRLKILNWIWGITP